MATTNDLKNGMTLNLDGNLMNVVEFQHVKPGKGGAFVRTKLKNVRTGRVLDRTFRADELGLYSGDLERFGMLSFDSWRACRLVVDTGLHQLGWSRDHAIDYLLANSALTRTNVENEVDRYVAWPGQALAYMVGRLELVRLRELAQARLGGRFDLRAFHDVVLGTGGVSLSVLAQVVEGHLVG